MKIQLKDLNNSEYLRFLEIVTTFITDDKVVYKFLKKWVDPLVEQVVFMNKTFRMSDSESRESLEPIDMLRDKLFLKIAGAIDGILYHNQKDALTHVKLLVKDYRANKETLDFRTKAQSVDGMVIEFIKFEDRTHLLDDLKVFRWVVYLKTVNNLYKLFSQTKNLSSFRNLSDLRANRSKADELYNVLISKLTLYSTVKGVDIKYQKPFIDAYQAVETLIKHCNKQIEQRDNNQSNK